MTKILIQMQGGLIQNIMSTSPNIEIIKMDEDYKDACCLDDEEAEDWCHPSDYEVVTTGEIIQEIEAFKKRFYDYKKRQ